MRGLDDIMERCGWGRGRVVETKGLGSVQREKHARDRDVWEQVKRRAAACEEDD
jgi:hypothetical protein